MDAMRGAGSRGAATQRCDQAAGMGSHNGSPPSATRGSLAADLRALGLDRGDVVMVHASMKAIGAVEGGPAAVLAALLDTLSADGTLMAYVSWDRSPYEETLDERQLEASVREAWPAFDPQTAGTYRGFGILNASITAHEGCRRSVHPDASMAAIGRHAAWLVRPHPLDSAYGPGSPVERFLEMRGKVLLLGAGPDALTVLHYAEAVADIPGKRRVTFEMPMFDADGRKVWRRSTDYDSNGILDCYADGEGPDAVECMGVDYLALKRAAFGRVGQADCRLIDAADLVTFGRRWLEERHGSAKGN